MTLQANSRHRLIFKIALIIIYLGFFTTQLSYRFYFLASYPCYSAGGGASRAANIGSMIPGTKNIFALSLDKRYDGKHLFAHPKPTVRLHPPLPVAREYAESRPVGIRYTPRIAATPRGPPFAA